MTITKRAIQSAFMELLNQRSLSKITVKDITDLCGINRNTFYYHYQDIPALLEEICSDAVERIVRKYPSIHSIQECLDAAMAYALENRRAVLHIYNSDNRRIYVNCLWRICEHMVSTYVDTVFAQASISREDRELIIRYHKCVCFGLLIDWISNGMRDDIMRQINRIMELKMNSIEALMGGSMGESNNLQD